MSKVKIVFSCRYCGIEEESPRQPDNIWSSQDGMANLIDVRIPSSFTYWESCTPCYDKRSEERKKERAEEEERNRFAAIIEAKRLFDNPSAFAERLNEIAHRHQRSREDLDLLSALGDVMKYGHTGLKVNENAD